MVNKDKPDHILELPSCPVAVAFHPEKPAVLTAGTLSGQIFVWDLAQPEDPLLGRSDATCAQGHQEP
eukprot:SAG31_NODE_23286_length_507_cov_0.973039_1_plen_66_part_01